MDKKFELYTWTYCPFCTRAKELLDSRGYKYKEYVLDNDDPKRQELIESSGQNTVPYIFLNDKLIGGFDDLKIMDDEGRL